MRPSHRVPCCSLLLVLAAGFGITGCSDPTRDKPAAVVQEATEPQTSEQEPLQPEATQQEATQFHRGPEARTKGIVSNRYDITTRDSTIAFVGSKVTGSNEGGFKAFGGQIGVMEGDPTKSSVHVSIDTTSLWADNDQLTQHLKSADFFDVETYPRAEFTSTGLAREGDHYVVSGNLNLHGVRKNISFPAEITVGDATVKVKSEFSIKRFDFGIVYPGKSDDLIRDDVLIKLDLVARRDRPADTMAR